MGKRLHHRFAHWLRLAVSGAFVLHSVFAPWGGEQVFAQNQDVMILTVTPASAAAPAAVTDLLASPSLATEGQITLTWTAPQGNAGGTPIPNQPVVAYSLRVATFSVASLSGDTTSWWNATSASNVSLQSPTYAPKAPGQLESYTLSNLTPGVTYYFAIKSISQSGVTSPIDAESASPNLQARAIATQFVTSSGTPLHPSGLSMSATGGQFTLNWHPVSLDINYKPITIDHYVVYRYDVIGSSPTQSTIVPPDTPTYTETVGGLTYYYAIVAVAIGGATSVVSNYVDSSSDLNEYIVAADDMNTRAVLTGILSRELLAANNIEGEDLELRLDRRQQDEVDVTLRSYHVGAFRTKTGIEVPNFAFSQSGMQVQLGLGATLGAGRLTPTQVDQLRQSQTNAGSIAQIVSVYWFNGGSYVRISDPVLTSNQALSVKVRNVGIYQVRATQIATQFQLTQGSPYPRVITPNDPSQNNRVFWFFNNPSDDPVTGTIYDIRGAKVCDLAVNGMSPTPNSLVWNGHDSRGAVVPSGVYLYRITAGKENQTGTLVVAR